VIVGEMPAIDAFGMLAFPERVNRMSRVGPRHFGAWISVKSRSFKIIVIRQPQAC